MDSANQILSNNELDENEYRKEALASVISSGEAVLMVGAGTSIGVGYISWKDLMDELGILAAQISENFNPEHPDDNLIFVEEIKEHIKSHDNGLDKYHQRLYSLFRDDPRDPQCLPWHRKLVGLPFRGVVTTNYDRVLEHALWREGLKTIEYSLKLDRPGDVSKFMSSLLNHSAVSQIAHLHGIFNEPERIVLSYNDYTSAYGAALTDDGQKLESQWPLRKKLLWAILATRRVVFVGFSLTDPYLNMMLELVARDLWHWDEPIHYAIMGIAKDSKDYALMRAATLKRKYGIEVVFYEIKDNSHIELENMVMSIAHTCGSASVPDTSTTRSTVHGIAGTSPAPNNVSSPIQSSALFAVSQRMKRRKERDEH